MAVEVKVIDNSKIIEVIYPEITTPKDLEESVIKYFSLKESGHKRCLADCSKIKGGHDIFDLFNNIALIQKYGVTRSHKEAIYFPQGIFAKSIVKMFVFAARNLGYNVRLFEKRDKAIEWLNS